MTQHTDFYTRLDGLQQRVTTARSAVQAGAAESDAQLRQRIDRAQADLDQSAENARQQVSQAGDSAQAKWAQVKADDAAEALDFADWAVENAQLAMLDAIHARAHTDQLAKAANNS